MSKIKTAISGLELLEKINERQQLAYSILGPQVQMVKKSRTAQVAATATAIGLGLSGSISGAVGVIGVWFGSKPITHAVAYGVAVIGEVDARTEAIMTKLNRRCFGDKPITPVAPPAPEAAQEAAPAVS